MNKYNDFIKEVRKIIGLKTVKVAYDDRLNSIHFLLSERQYLQLDNENSKMWERFSMLLDKYDYYHEFAYCDIEVFEEW
jgi:hypothetical protein